MRINSSIEETGQRPPRTVYILGAGFSVPFGLPPQARILERILDRRADDFSEERVAVRNFIESAFLVSAEDCAKVSLEDIYTVLDRAYAGRDTVAGRSGDGLLEMQGYLNLLIAATFNAVPRQQGREALVTFARALAQYAGRHGKSSDPFAIISLNWDIVLDHALYDALEGLSNERSGKGVLDYGMYFHSLRQGGETRVLNGTTALKFGAPTIKLLKLHASMNWLYCPNCERMYIRPERKLILNPIPCKCQKQIMRPMLVSPTFLKNFDNVHLRNVWHLAGAKLREAERVVFIGYSLPQADFDFRYLLQRHLKSEMQIEVVDYLDESLDEIPRILREKQLEELESRYRHLLGHRLGRKAFHYSGTEAFLVREAQIWR
jgi:hypothetical protein